MRLLIDTQSILWFESSDNKLPKPIKEIIENPNNECFVSIASLWEMAIKVSREKLNIEMGFENFPAYLLSKGFKILDIKPEHLTILIKLPFHHKDPFDRLIIAQAVLDNLTIISSDDYFSAYPVAVIW
jgi:PIN domain nuclease of toxin-antitoxin system